MAVLIKANNEVSVVSPANGKWFTFSEIKQNYLHNKFIVFVPPSVHGPVFLQDGDKTHVIELSGGHQMWHDEDAGMVNDAVLNDIASELAFANMWGDVLIIAPDEQEPEEEPDDEGEWLDEDDYYRHELTRCNECNEEFEREELEDGVCHNCLND
jgi:hypothetical protein